MKIEVLVLCGFCIAVLLLNLWTLHRAEKLEERIKNLLAPVAESERQLRSKETNAGSSPAGGTNGG